MSLVFFENTDWFFSKLVFCSRALIIIYLYSFVGKVTRLCLQEVGVAGDGPGISVSE